MEKLQFDYKRIVRQSDLLSNTGEKIKYLKKVLDEFQKEYLPKTLRRDESILLSPEERADYFEKQNIRLLLKTKIFLEEINDQPDKKTE